MPYIASVGEKVAQLRMDRGWTQQELARISGVSQATISRIEHPSFSTRVHPTVADGISHALGFGDGSDLFSDIAERGRPAGSGASYAHRVVPGLAHSGIYVKPGVTSGIHAAYCRCGMQLPSGRAVCDYCDD